MPKISERNLRKARRELIAYANTLGHDMREFEPNSDSQCLENSRCRKCDGWLFLRWDHQPATIEGHGIPIKAECLSKYDMELSDERVARVK